MMKKAIDCLRSLQLFGMEKTEQSDPLKVCLPFCVLNEWQKTFAETTPDHNALDQLQHNFRQALYLFNLILKEAKSAAKSVTGHIESCKKAVQELCFFKSCITYLFVILDLDLCGLKHSRVTVRYFRVPGCQLRCFRAPATVLQGASYSAVLQGAN